MSSLNPPIVILFPTLINQICVDRFLFFCSLSLLTSGSAENLWWTYPTLQKFFMNNFYQFTFFSSRNFLRQYLIALSAAFKRFTTSSYLSYTSETDEKQVAKKPEIFWLPVRTLFTIHDKNNVTKEEFSSDLVSPEFKFYFPNAQTSLQMCFEARVKTAQFAEEIFFFPAMLPFHHINNKANIIARLPRQLLFSRFYSF